MVDNSKTLEELIVREAFMLMVKDELDQAYTKHGAEPWSRHEFYAILLEEVDELWDDIKSDEDLDLVLSELVQVAAMCIRYAETGDMKDKIIRMFEQTRGEMIEEGLCMGCGESEHGHDCSILE